MNKKTSSKLLKFAYSIGLSLVLAISMLASLSVAYTPKAHAAPLPAYRYTKNFDASAITANMGGFAVDTDSSGNVYATGSFSGTVGFDGVGGIDKYTSVNTSSFLTKYNANGTYAYTKIFDTSAVGANASGASVATDTIGNVYVTGSFTGTVVFDGVGGTDSYAFANGSSFLTKYNANGNYAYTKIFDTSAAGANAAGTGVATDTSGNLYITGYFVGSVIFDGVGGTNNQTSVNESTFLTKYNANGTYGYTKIFDASAVNSYTSGTGIATDTNGNIYITGYYAGTVVFDGVGGTDSQTSANQSTFITKYNANGSYGYTKVFDASAAVTNVTGASVATDTSGSIFITGNFSGTVVFDGVGGIDSRTTTNQSTFITKYNANGSYGYTKIFDTSSGSAGGTGIATDTSGNIYVTGYFSGTVVFDGIGGTDSQTSSNQSGLLTKYNANGTYGYTKISDTSNGNEYRDGVATDISGNIYITGDFNGTVVFDGIGGTDSQTADNGTEAAYLIKYNANGSYGYTKIFDTTALTSITQGTSVATDSSGNVYVTGGFTGTVVFDGIGGTDKHTSVNGSVFLTKYNANGTYGYTKIFDTSAAGASANGTGVATDINGNIYITGTSTGSVVFDGIGGTDSQTMGQTAFLTKYNANGTYGYTKILDTTSGSGTNATGVVVDSSGNIYFTGYFSGTVVFDGIGGTDSQTTPTSSPFLTKYNANGSYSYTKIFDTSGVSSGAYGYSVTTDSIGNIYVTGSVFSGTVVFDGVGGTDSRTIINSVNVNSFLTKYNANGSYGFTKIFDVSAVGAYASSSSVATDSTGNVYVTGNFGGTVVFDGVGGTDSHTSANGSAFLTKYNASGTYGNTKTLDTTAVGANAQGNGVATDTGGNIYFTGYFNGTVVFDGVGGIDSHTSANQSSFLTKYNANGTYGYTKIFDASAVGANAQGYGVATSASGNIYITGYFLGTVLFYGPSNSLTSNNTNMFLASFQIFIPPQPISLLVAPNTGYGAAMANPLQTLVTYILVAIGLATIAVKLRKYN